MKLRDFAVGNGYFTIKALHIPSENYKYMEMHACTLEVEFHHSYSEYLCPLTELAVVSPWSNYTSACENTSFHKESRKGKPGGEGENIIFHMIILRKEDI